MSAIDPTEARYFAALDALDPAVMTYWYRVKRVRAAGQLAWWPPKSSYRRATRDDVLKGLTTDEHRAAVTAYYKPIMEARAQIEAVIDADPDVAAARFAGFHTACCHCGKGLTDEQSKVYGVGPECRRGMSPAELDFYVAATGRAHAECAS